MIYTVCTLLSCLFSWEFVLLSYPTPHLGSTAKSQLWPVKDLCSRAVRALRGCFLSLYLGCIFLHLSSAEAVLVAEKHKGWAESILCACRLH